MEVMYTRLEVEERRKTRRITSGMECRRVNTTPCATASDNHDSTINLGNKSVGVVMGSINERSKQLVVVIIIIAFLIRVLIQIGHQLRDLMDIGQG